MTVNTRVTLMKHVGFHHPSRKEIKRVNFVTKLNTVDNNSGFPPLSVSPPLDLTTGICSECLD